MSASRDSSTGFIQIIDRLGFERLQRVVGIGRDEHEQRRLDLHQALDDREAVETGHLDVEEDKVGLVGLDGADRFAPVLAFVDDLDILVRLKAKLEPWIASGSSSTNIVRMVMLPL